MAKVTLGGRSYDVEVKGERVVVDGFEYAISVRDDGAHKTVRAGDIQYRVQLPPADQRQSGMDIQVDYRPFTLEFEGRFGGGPAPREARTASAAAAPRSNVKGGVAAPIAGKVLKLVAKVGDTVKAGDVLLVLEAMKMENEIKSSADGTVTAMPVAEGARVAEGDTLAVVE